ncbi:MAG: hypothetical protein ACTHK8_18950 [Ginsengibacter sp.]
MSKSYENGLLTISIPTEDPEGLHAQLMKGLNRAMRNYIISKDDCEEQLALIQLLESLLPENDLSEYRA